MQATYDAIISLGGNCAAASQLRMRGLRLYSLPFDWTSMDSPRTIEWLKTGFENDFADFCLRENLVPLERGGAGVAPFKYKDMVSGYSFIHHFWTEAETEKGYLVTYKILRRRIERLLQVVEKSQKILFILATNFEYDLDVVVRLLNFLRERNPQKIIDFHVLQHRVSFKNPVTLAEKWPIEVPFTGGRYARSIFTYDFSRTDTEWDFLDEISLTGARKTKKFRCIDKFKYRIWKHLSKYFRDNGCACVGVRFR